MHAVRKDVIATCYMSSMALDRVEPSWWDRVEFTNCASYTIVALYLLK